ncbi:MAG: acyl-CoA dehydratase activase-related protein [Clostridiales bacterium]|jgi:predicted nucleotide-binding protein (sugar kinase/HSP70/actin superfamily)|nr:acyl-CoA dehydratase activase-related protein [Clostridiales bacterium]
MTIGLPRALLYYRYSHLWENFFTGLGCDTLTSPETNKAIVAEGARCCASECCLPSKIYMGHVRWLTGKCDYILVPRLEGFGPRDKVCVKFNALYDIVRNTFKDAPLLDYDIDHKRGRGELAGFLRMGAKLGRPFFKTLAAYNSARGARQAEERLAAERQDSLMRARPEVTVPKVLIVSHPYNTHDNMLGRPIAEHIRRLGAQPVFADQASSAECARLAGEISPSLYWTFNKELVGAIKLYEKNIDGVVFVTAFPCGQDALVNELVMDKLKHSTPMINIVLDEIWGDAGIQTRIESFMDIIDARRLKYENNIIPAHG